MLCWAEREGRFWIQLVCGIRLRALALAGTELDGIYRNAEYFIFGLGVVGPPLLEDYCMLGVGLVDHSRLLSPLLFFTPFLSCLKR